MERLAEDNSLYFHGAMLRFVVPSDKLEDNNRYSGPGSLKEWKKQKKKFISIELTGDEIEDKKRFEFIRNEARRLKYTHDTTHIIKVHFTDANTYGQFVQLVSMMVEDKHKRYTLYRDDFYILGEPPELPETSKLSLIDL